jgi:hypothetical protein
MQYATSLRKINTVESAEYFNTLILDYRVVELKRVYTDDLPFHDP